MFTAVPQLNLNENMTQELLEQITQLSLLINQAPKKGPRPPSNPYPFFAESNNNGASSAIPAAPSNGFLVGTAGASYSSAP